MSTQGTLPEQPVTSQAWTSAAEPKPAPAPATSPRPQPSEVVGSSGGPAPAIPQASSDAVREKLVRRAQRAPQTRASPVPASPQRPEVTRELTIQQYLDRPENRRLVSKLLGRWMTPDRLLALGVTVLRQNPELLSCEVPSLVGALVYCAQLRLVPGPIGHVYFVPFMDSKRGVRQVQPILGYRGLAELARRSGQLVAIHGGIVREGDHFRYRLGTQPFLEHVLASDLPKDPEQLPPATHYYLPPATHYYIVAYYRDGMAIPHILTPAQVEWHRKFSRAKDSAFWTQHYDVMALKTVIRDAAWRWLPLSLEGQYALARDEQPIESPEELEAIPVEAWEERTGLPATVPASSPAPAQSSPKPSAEVSQGGQSHANELF